MYKKIKEVIGQHHLFPEKPKPTQKTTPKTKPQKVPTSLFKSMPIAEKLKVIEKLKKSASSCMDQATKVNTEVNGNWTNRRQRFADSAQKKKDTLISRANTLYGLAEQWKDGTLDDLLFYIRGKSDIETVLYSGFPNPPDEDTPIGGWYREEYPKRKKKADQLGIISKDVEKRMIGLLKSISWKSESPEDSQAKLLREKIKAVRTYDIPGFFPTPDDLIDKMIDYAKLEDGLSLLEPSAGIGSILDRVVYHGYKLQMDAVEVCPSLEEIIHLKGYNSSCEDILNTDKILGSGWDRILMNPPFEKGQDIDHVLHCFNTYLKPGGILVSIMSAGIQTNSKKKYQDFRDFVIDNDGIVITAGEAFKKAFVATGVSTIILVLNKEL